MKKKLAVLLGVLVLSSVGFSAAKKAPASGSSLESSLSNLEAQLQKLEQMILFLNLAKVLLVNKAILPVD